MVTRLGLYGGARKPYGSFAGKGLGAKSYVKTITRHGLYGGARPPYGDFSGKVESDLEDDAIITSGGYHFQARPTQEAIDKWLAQELDPNVSVKVKVREFAPQLEQSDPALFEDLVSARQAIEQFQRPLLPSEIEKVRDGFVSITDLLPDYRLDEMEEEAIVLLMMM